MVLLEATMGGIAIILIVSLISHPDNFNPDTLWNKRILITDTSTAVGEQLAYGYAKLKTRLTIVGSDSATLNEIAEKCNELGAVKVDVLHGNITDWKFRKSIIRQAEKFMGGLDYLILNHLPDYQKAEWTGSRENLTELKNIMDMYFLSYVELASNALPALRKSKGNIGVITSLVGKVPMPMLTTHTANEAALRGFFPALRQELKQQKTGITITSIALGYLESENGTNAVGRNNPFFNPKLTTKVSHAADAIILNVGLGKTELSFPFLSQVQFAVHTFLPSLYEGL